MIRTPNRTQPGVTAHGIVETIDVYPTIADLCGLPTPAGLAGASLNLLVEDPNRSGKTAAFGTVSRIGHIGRTLRTDRYRLVHWQDTKTAKTVLVELYDHQHDPLETESVATKHPDLVRRLLNQLNAEETESGKQSQ
jgi:arylsulfatase A-like enzyme